MEKSYEIKKIKFFDDMCNEVDDRYNTWLNKVFDRILHFLAKVKFTCRLICNKIK